MRPPLTPGPPLQIEDEPCAHGPPSGRDYLRAATAILVVGAVGVAFQLTAALITHRVWGLATVIIGVLSGVAVHYRAGRRRSWQLGLMAAVGTLISGGLSYAFAWLPIITPSPGDPVDWYYVAMLGLGVFIAFLLAGPRTEVPDLHE